MPPPGPPGPPPDRGVDHDGLRRCAPTSSVRHRTSARIIGRWSLWPTCSARSSTVSTRTASRSRSASIVVAVVVLVDRVAAGLVRGGAAPSRRGRASLVARRPGRRACRDLVPGLADLDPDRARRAGARRGRSAAPVTPSPVGAHPSPSVAARVRHRFRRAAADPVRGPHDRGRRVPRHRRLPLRSRDRDDRRDRARRLHPPPRPTSRSATARTSTSTSRRTPTTTTTGALELGKLKATDGAFGYELPPGTDPADFASAIIWCKQFSHLFAVAPLAAI